MPYNCSVLSVHLTSSKSLVGIAGVIAEIQKEKKVYLFYIHQYLNFITWLYPFGMLKFSSTAQI